MPSPELLATLASYVPPLVARRFVTDPTPPTSPTAERFSAAVLFADVSGFTALTERLAKHGPAGAEELTGLLNIYFGQLIDLVTTHGGDILKFAGDALLAVWQVGEGRGDLTTMTRRAAQCALAVQAQLHNYEVAQGVHLSLSLSLGAGEVVLAHVGGVYKRWEFTVSGPPLVQVSVAEHLAHAGEVVLSPVAWALISDSCTGQRRSAGPASGSSEAADV